MEVDLLGVGFVELKLPAGQRCTDLGLDRRVALRVFCDLLGLVSGGRACFGFGISSIFRNLSECGLIAFFRAHQSPLPLRCSRSRSGTYTSSRTPSRYRPQDHRPVSRL